MTRILTAVLALAACGLASASENFVSSPTSPYPHGCATLDQMPEAVRGARAQLLDGLIPMPDPFRNFANTNVRIRFLRQGCAEANRSLLIMEASIATTNDGVFQAAFLPAVRGAIGEDGYPLRLATEPNTYLDDDAFGLIFEGETLRFFLDTPSPYSTGYDPDEVMSPAQYNGALEVEMADPLFGAVYVAQIPAYDGSLQWDALPLGGRLSGNWVSDGAADQGFVVAFEELADGTQLVFLSWYTYGADGSLLWLTGAASFEVGASQADIPIELVTNGEFLGDKAADRQVVGDSQLRAIHCNRLELDFDLQAIGLGTGSLVLKRLFSLETAGHACRDQSAREAAVGD